MNNSRNKSIQSMCAMIFAFAVALTPSVRAALFTGLGGVANFPHPAISADGKVVVGVSGNAAYRWTLATGKESLGPLISENYYEATDVSSDGSVAVGSETVGLDAFGWGVSEALRWNAGRWESLGGGNTRAWGVSADGSVVVGDIRYEIRNRLRKPFRWTAEDGMVDLGEPHFPDGRRLVNSHVEAISGDGKVIVGYGGSRNYVAWRWTDEEKFVDLGHLPDSDTSWSTDVTPDGSIIVGWSGKEGMPGQPFRWTNESGMVALAGWDSQRFGSTVQSYVSDDGSTIVGYSFTMDNFAPFIWDEENGVRDLVEVLISEYGLEDQLTGWKELLALGISGDGRRIVGMDRFNRHWIAILEPELQAGDADQDFDFDQVDLVQVQVAAKYLTGEAATWGEGDWNVGADGYRFAPATGDGVFNQLDIVAAQVAGTYLTGSYEAVQPKGRQRDSQTSIGYNATTGQLWVDAPAGGELTSINIDSSAGIFTGDPAGELGGSFDNDADNNIFKATFGGSFGSMSFGNVAQTGLTEDFVISDLTVIGSLLGGGSLGEVDLIYVPVPEPYGLLLICVGAVGVLLPSRPLRRSSKQSAIDVHRL